MFHIPISSIKYLCAKGEKTWRTPLIRGDHRPPTSGRRGNPTNQAEEEEGDVVEIVTTGDRDVVKEGHFTSESAQILLREIMGCNRDLENIKQNINDFQNKMKNIIDVFRENLKPFKILNYCSFFVRKIF
ncbi:hypothetical protein AB205_0094800 [Aquarana catesbeiana]|uniref:Uncharacterized protein n=1 Tax=Aquarana catesbeiana TaxID=8400 RepID=A0A2G9R9R4_AQUCT|nr:hypothetical protein AB205_0094800 [Aquarana catesbeiana]